MFTSVSRWMSASIQPPNHTPVAAITSVVTVVPTAASRPKASATGMPHKSATIRSRRWWSVPAIPCTRPVDHEFGIDGRMASSNRTASSMSR
jgi:hypothetical protein